MQFPREVILKENGCIYIDAAPTIGRYRSLNYEGQRWMAHRLSYHLNVEPIGRRPPTPSTGLVLHDCDDGFCINPDHLHLGTTRENMLECQQRSEAWNAWARSQKGRRLSQETREKIAKSQSNYQQSRSAEDRRMAMAPVQAIANKFAQTPAAKAKRLASRWTPERRKEHSTKMLGNQHAKRN